MAGYLLDSHTFLWAKTSPREIHASTLAEITKPQNQVFVSVAALWELAIKAELGKLGPYAPLIERDPESLLGVLRESNFALLPIALSHALAAARLPLHHRDPFDRLMIAQAQAENLVAVTRDAAFAKYNVRVLPA
jgi:PIN domain nuclease of toxin-antitoxin system